MRYRADIRTLAYLAVSLGLLAYQWTRHGLANWYLYPFSLFFAYTAAVMSHNQNHLPMWGKHRNANLLTNYLIGMLYGHPAIAWVPTHNQNHHKYNNKPGDTSISPRFFKSNHLLAILTYPTATGIYQQASVSEYFREARKSNPRLFWEGIAEYVFFFGTMIAAFAWNWKKAFVLLLLPQQFSIFCIQCTNYLQHIELDPDSKWNHSRNFEGWLLNALLFNNGYHTVHHLKPGIHWSETPKLHAELRHKMDERVMVPNMPWFIFKMFFLSPLRGQVRRPIRTKLPDKPEVEAAAVAA
jgi:beta-carotene hydroxylase